MKYVIDVADLFLARCRNVTILDPMDFTIIAEWEKEDIPLPLVLDSINEICDELDTNSSKVDSICYFQDTVKQKFINWLQTNIELRKAA